MSEWRPSRSAILEFLDFSKTSKNRAKSAQKIIKTNKNIINMILVANRRKNIGERGSEPSGNGEEEYFSSVALFLLGYPNGRSRNFGKTEY